MFIAKLKMLQIIKVFTVHDDVRGTSGDIRRSSCTMSDEKDVSGYPKTITVGPYSYKFERITDGVAIYSSVNGAGDEYRLEKNADGTFALNQYAGDKGAGTKDIASNRRLGFSSSRRTQQFRATYRPTSEMRGSTSNGGQFNIAKESDGSVKVTIPIPYQYASTVTISAQEAQGKTDEQLVELAKKKAEEAAR